MSDNQYYINKYKLDSIIIANQYSTSNNEPIDGIVSPLKVDNRQIFAPIDFQGATPHCAGFSAANICESIIWKNTGKIVQLDAHQIYAKAKELDGCPDIEGSYPEYTLKAAIDLGTFPNKKFIVKTFRKCLDLEETKKSLKHLVHKYDFLLGGFMIKENWYQCNSSNYVIKKSSGKTIGGHAVCIVGYDKTGLIIANSWDKNWGAKGFAIVSWAEVQEDFMYGSYLAPVS